MIDVKNWRELQDDITTDSLWISSTSTKNRPMFIIPHRDFLPKNDPNFHGLFIPEIPYQFIRRFLPENGLIWDCFGGSGTTHRVAEYLNERCILTDLHPTQDYIIKGDAVNYTLVEKADLVFCHPPYHDIVKYSDDPNDGSNQGSIEKFLEWMNAVANNIYNNTKKGSTVILVVGNLYTDGEEKTLGVWAKDEFCKDKKFKCKAHIIKDYGETKGTEGKNYNLNYVRQLRGGYNNFYGDNIFILKRN